MAIGSSRFIAMPQNRFSVTSWNLLAHYHPFDRCWIVDADGGAPDPGSSSADGSHPPILRSLADGYYRWISNAVVQLATVLTAARHQS